MRLNLSQKSGIYLSFFLLLSLIAKTANAVPLQVGILIEPGYEYRTLKDIGPDEEKFKMAGLSGSAIAQIMLVTKSPVVP